jgi:hypothetical protein
MSVEWLTDFAWVDENDALHIHLPRMLRELGVPDTADNREELMKIATDTLVQLLGKTPAVIKVTE